MPSLPEQVLANAAQSMSSIAQDAKNDHAATAAMALGHAGLQNTLPLPMDLEGDITSPFPKPVPSPSP